MERVLSGFHVLLSAQRLLLVFTFVFNPSYTKTRYPYDYDNRAAVANAVQEGWWVQPL